jgi:hypothetical protein
MTPNSPAIRVRKDGEGLTPVDRPRIEIVLDPVHFCSHETKPHATALKPIVEFAHTSEAKRDPK